VDRANKTKKEKSKKEKIEWVGREKEEGGRRKSVRTPNRLQPTTLVTPTPAASTTPSLKIRLPRLSSVNLQTNPSPPLIPSLNFGSASHA
jgi:hypothetical protein